MTFRQIIASIPGARRLHRRWVPAPPAPGVYDDRAHDPLVRADLKRLARANRFSRRSVVDPTSRSVVTMTTHGPRLRRAHIAIESIARGNALPSRLILWLDDAALAGRLPRPIRRLQSRGLEVLLVSPGMRVHTKYFFYVQSIQHHERALVTSDDDIVYPPDWLKALEASGVRHPGSVSCYRAHTVQFDGEAIAPYATWPACISDEPSFRHFGTSVSGQLFPAEFLNFVRAQGEEFLEVAPHNDDIWLHCLAVRAGVKVAQVTNTGQHFAFVPGSQSTGLYQTNTLESGNDRQIKSTYKAADIERMLAD